MPEFDANTLLPAQCPECTGDYVYSMTTATTETREWVCSGCKHRWPGSQEDVVRDPSIWKSSDKG